MSEEKRAPGAPEDRRSFLTKLGGAALAASGLGAIACATSAAASSGTMPGASAGTMAGGATTGAKIRPIGVQLYTVRDEMQKDVAATLARVAQIGYTEVEFAGYYNHTPAEIRAMLDQNRLTAPSAHIPLQQLQGDLPNVIAAAKTIGHQYIVCPWLDPSQRGSTVDAWKSFGTTLTDIGRQVQAAGLQFAYHNHDFEFQKIGDVVPFEVLLANSDPSLVKMEMDLYWATKGGQDPLAWFAKYPGRFPLVHVKDAKGAAMDMAPVGEGTIDWKRIFGQRAQAGIQHYFVEHDSAAQYPGGAFASIAASYSYLSNLTV
ncbi:MAG: sugar phosphate isomerase/epimerase [Gemmatimonadaceae bacterium]|nr:sugar phosphate isomerase/epimerase [Gemmatimonadaceae bacterium]NUS98978.1 sugar phosphate isomerase/epimerase [Gemmatimonadaceae bacterium]